MREQRVFLEHEAHAPRFRRNEHPRSGHRPPEHPDLSGIRGLQTGDDPQQGGLAAAAGPKHRREAPGRNVQVHPGEHGAVRIQPSVAEETLLDRAATKRRFRDGPGASASHQRTAGRSGRPGRRTTSSVAAQKSSRTSEAAAARPSSTFSAALQTVVARVAYPVGASMRVAGQLLDAGQEHERKARSEAGSQQRQRDAPVAAPPTGAQGPRGVIEPRAERPQGGLQRCDRLRQHVDRVGEDQQRQRLVEERRHVHREEHKREPDDQSRQPEADVRNGAQGGASLRREADRQEGHRDGQRRRRNRGEQCHEARPPERGNQPRGRSCGRLEQPVETDANRQDERRQQHQGAQAQSCPFPAAEPVDAGRPGLRGSWRRAGRLLETTRRGEHQQRREHEQQGKPRSGVAVQRSSDLVVDGPGEGLVAQQGNGAEIAQGVEGRKQSTGQQGGGQQGQGHPPESPPAAGPQHSGGVLERRVQHCEPGAGRQVHVRVVE